MEAEKPVEISTLDLVEEFQPLDVGKMASLSRVHQSCYTMDDRLFEGNRDGLEAETLVTSIGGEDLSGILSVGGDEEEDDHGESDGETSMDILDQADVHAAMSTPFQSSPAIRATPAGDWCPLKSVLCETCFTAHDVLSGICKSCRQSIRRESSSANNHATTDNSCPTYASARGSIAVEKNGDNCRRKGVLSELGAGSEGWDSEDSETSSRGDMPIGSFHSATPCAGGPTGSEMGDCSNPNMSSPTRPAEASSDWDCAEQQSDETATVSVKCDKNAPVFHDMDVGLSDTRTSSNPSPRLRSPTCSSRTGTLFKDAAREPEDSTLQAGSHVIGTLEDDHVERYEDAKARPFLSSRRGREVVYTNPLDTVAVDNGASRQLTKLAVSGSSERNHDSPVQAIADQSYFACVSGGDDETGVTAAETAAAETATIETLRLELNLLKEHVLRSQQKREAQLGELLRRLEAQERHGCLPSKRYESRQAATKGRVEEGVGVIPESIGGTRCPEESSGGITPPGAVVHNPFAAQEGGAATTPRDHFPAFEDALHDGGSDDYDVPRATDGHNHDDEAEVDESLQSEGFDFSIDTLSHINNHTDFGTEAPVTVTVTANPLTTRNNTSESGRTVSRDLDEGSPARKIKTNFVNREEESDDVFDGPGTAAEEAFFADACATANLQTPVKRVLTSSSSASSAVAGVAVRTMRQYDRRGARGTPAGRPGPAAATGSASSAAQERVAASVVSGQLESSQLCMADFFALATRQLDAGVEDGGGAGSPTSVSGRTVAERRPSASSPGSEKLRPAAGVDVGTQTTWSFSGHEGVRFMSTPLRTPLRTLVEAGRDVAPGPGGLAGLGLRCTSEGDADFPPINEDFAREETVDLHDQRDEDRGSFCTPQRSRALSQRTPSDSVKAADCGDASAGVSHCVSNAATLLDSPGLSPILDARRHPGGEKCAVDGIERSMEVVENDAGGCKQERNAAGSTLGRPAQRIPRELSPILSNGDVRVQSGGGATRPVSATRGRWRFADETAVNGGATPFARKGGREERETTGRGENSYHAGGGWDVGGARGMGVGHSTFPEGEQLWAPATTRILARTPSLHDSSVNVSALSLLRASSTLQTMAILEETARSCSSYAPGGSSFPGELFADSRLLESVTSQFSRREDVTHPDAQCLPRGKWLIAPSPPGRAERRPRSAPTLPPEQMADHFTRPEPRVRQQKQGHSPAAGGAPPAVVDAWLAGAVERFYGNSTVTADNRQILQEGSTRMGRMGNQGSTECLSATGPFDLDPALTRSPLTDARRRPTNPAAIQNNDVQYAISRAVAAPAYPPSRVDSPPPPPPPVGEPGRVDGIIEGSVPEISNEDDEFFYQRQRLLHRAVTAAAKHGGVRQLPVSGSSACGASGERFALLVERAEERENHIAGGSGERRHSDPLSWKTPLGALVVGRRSFGVNGGIGAAAVVEGRWAGRSELPYTKRRTSAYWRERLGKTQ